MNRPLSEHRSRFDDHQLDPIRATVRTEVQRFGLGYDDVEDCAQNCVLRIWLSCIAGKIHFEEIQTNHTLVRVCARNTARNLLRKHHRERSHCDLYSELGREEGDLPEPHDPHLTPEEEVCMKDLPRRIFQALSPLKPDELKLFVRHHVQEQSVAEIAKATGKKYHAIYQAVQRLNAKLPNLLERAGLTLEECVDYLRLQAGIVLIAPR